MEYPNCYYCEKEGKKDRGFIYNTKSEENATCVTQCLKHFKEHHTNHPWARMKLGEKPDESKA